MDIQKVFLTFHPFFLTPSLFPDSWTLTLFSDPLSFASGLASLLPYPVTVVLMSPSK